MPTLTPKERVRRAVDALPADASLEDAIERLVLLHKVEVGLAQAAAGDGLTTQADLEAEIAARRRARA